MFGCFITLLTTMLLTGGATVDIAASISALGDGTLGFTYQVRDGVTGNGRSVRVKIGPNTSTTIYHGHYSDIEDLQDEGPAHIIVRVRGGKAVKLELNVGGSGKQALGADHYLGEVAPATAVDWLMGLINGDENKLADEAVLAVAIARDVDLAEPFLAVAHDRDRDPEVRSSVLHWLVILAGERMLTDVTSIIEDDTEDVEFREHAIFALSQLDEDEVLAPLMDIARNHRDPRLRRSALFALSEFEGNDEVVALLEEILTE